MKTQSGFFFILSIVLYWGIQVSATELEGGLNECNQANSYAGNLLDEPISGSPGGDEPKKPAGDTTQVDPNVDPNMVAATQAFTICRSY